MQPIERALYAHLRFVMRRLDHEMHSESIKEIAHAIVSFFEMNHLTVVKRKAALVALSWAEEAMTDLPVELRPPSQFMTEVEAELRVLAEQLGTRPVRCDAPECPYHRVTNHQTNDQRSEIR
jgi:hypothetical protein